MTTYYAIGSSITSGASTETGDCFPKMLAKELNVNLVNLGVPGSTVGTKYHPNSSIWEPDKTLGAILKATKSLANTTFHKGDFVTLECINDFRVSIDYGDFRDSYIELLTTLQNNKSFIDNGVKLYILTPHQFNEASGRPGCEQKNLYNLYLDEYVDAMINIGRDFKKFTKLINMSTAFPPTSEYVYDGVHLSVKAKQEYIKILKPLIAKKKTVLYVPLDDRPCNDDRVKLSAQAMGISLLMPPLSYYKNYLDNQGTNDRGWQIGMPDKIEQWIQEATEQYSIDGFIFSLDQLCSGGLIGARKFNHPISANDSIARIKRIMNMTNNKPVYLFDVILRLATTLGFDGLSTKDYNASWDYASVPRRRISGENETTTRQEIINNYNTGVDGKTIDPNKYGFTKSKEYLTARARKFNLNCEVGKILAVYPNANFIYAVGDANNNNTIQTNEINHIKRHITEAAEQVFAGIDELGVMMVGRIANDFYSTMPAKVRVAYFGSGADMLADAYDYETLRTNVNKHINVAGGVLVSGDEAEDIEILILTRPGDYGYVTNQAERERLQAEEVSRNANDIHWCVNNNTRNRNHPTIVIDASWYKSKGAELQSRLLGNYGSKMELPKLLAYSNWNTVGNAVGMAIGHGLGRYAYLYSQNKIDKRDALTGQVKLLFTEYAKDICYLVGGKWNLDRDFGAGADNFATAKIDMNSTWFKQTVMQGMTDPGLSVAKLAELFYRDGYVYEDLLNYKLTQINWINFPYEDGINFYPITFPWKRTFECSMPVNVSFK